MEAYGPLVWRTLWRVLRAGEDDVEDCFQETFLEFLTVAKQATVERPGALLVRIATRRAIDRIRRRSSDRSRLIDIDQAEAAKGIEPSLAAVGEELAEALRVALAALPEQQSAVFVMTQLEQMPYDEVAGALGVSANHVAVLLHRARATLQVKLKELISIARR